MIEYQLPNLNTQGERLKFFLKYFNLNQVILAQMLGVRQGNVSVVITTGKNIPKRWLLDIQKEYPTVNIDWLESGKGEMIKQQELQEPNTEYKSELAPLDNDRLTRYLEKVMGKVAFLESEVEDLRNRLSNLEGKK
ncbi:MAG: hypothetical protein ACRC78_04180 [Planktothrix sp.]